MPLVLECYNTQRAPRLFVTDGVLCIWEIQMSVRTLRRQNHHADHTTRATIPLDCLSQSTLDEADGLFLVHSFLPVGIAVSVDVGRTGSSNGIRLLV